MFFCGEVPDGARGDVPPDFARVAHVFMVHEPLNKNGYYDIDADQLILGLINKIKEKLYWSYNSLAKHRGFLKPKHFEEGKEEIPPMAA